MPDRVYQRITQGNLRGLGALLFDDGKTRKHSIHRFILDWNSLAPPASERREQDAIHKTLNAIGVMYSHHNDEILMPSRIEEERSKKMLVRVRCPC